MITRRSDNDIYDGKGELGRDSVIAVWKCISSGGTMGNAEIGGKIGYEHNTTEKALRILEHHGYVRQCGMQPNKTRSGQIALYCAIASDKIVQVSKPCSCGSWYRRGEKCNMCVKES
jgi:hypothetical protein